MQEIVVDNITRWYFLYQPKAKGPLPLVVVLHGGEGSVRSMRVLGFEKLADTSKFAVVYPKAEGKYWVDGYKFPKENKKINDISFLKALITELTDKKIADPEKVYITGFSNGGMMAYRAGCELSPMLAAIAPVSANLPASYECKPTKALAVLAINGTADPLVPWHGGQGTLQRRNVTGEDYTSVADSIKPWLDIGKCSDNQKMDALPRKDNKDKSIVIHHSWEGCEVEVYEIKSGGHMWPGQRSTSTLLLGKTMPMGHESMQLDATQAIWDFFQDKKRK